MLRNSIAIITAIFISGCAQQASNSSAHTANSVQSAVQPAVKSSVLSMLRANAAPVDEVKIDNEQESGKTLQMQIDNSAHQATAVLQSMPSISNAPLAPPAEQVAAGGPIVTQTDQNQNANSGMSFWPFNQMGGQAQAQQQVIASYGGYSGSGVPPPPPNASGSLVPPPPAVSLSTQAQTLPPMYGMPYDSNNSQYGNMYAQPRPGLFGSGQRSVSDESLDDTDNSSRYRRSSFALITPSGMETRSAYKQRDDLKLLWKGALSVSSLHNYIDKDGKLAEQITRIDVDLPAGSSKGSFAISQRQVDSLFKQIPLDKKIVDPVRKLETSVVQSYYRYLYAYNKYVTAVQTVAARKQEGDTANSISEQQRAAADLAQAKADADSAKDDMKSAQWELSAVVGPQAAKLVIGRVSGISPNTDSLVQADTQNSEDNQKSGFWGSILHRGKVEPKTTVTITPQAKPQTQAKNKDQNKNKNIVVKDTHPTQKIAAAAVKQTTLPPSASKQATSVATGGYSSSSIVFKLKNVSITPRKSMLTVAISNSGNQAFTFDPDVIVISEGNRRLSDATIRTEFDTTTVAPNQEVTGTIIIFGRPWSDRLTVCISDNGKNIQMRR